MAELLTVPEVAEELTAAIREVAAELRALREAVEAQAPKPKPAPVRRKPRKPMSPEQIHKQVGEKLSRAGIKRSGSRW